MPGDLSSLPLSAVHRVKLQTAGFTTLQDITEVTASELAREVQVSKEEALDIVELVRQEAQKACNGSSSCGLTALDLLHDEQGQQSVITFCQQLDSILGGGVALSKITEFCGAPGVGKTQICMQLAADVHIPESLGGLEGEAVYIDTEGSLIIDRLLDICKATLSHCQQISRNLPSTPTGGSSLSLESMMAGIYCFRCQDYVQLTSLIHLLPDFIRDHPKVKLVILDSIAFHFRHDFDDFALRTRLLNGISQQLMKLASVNKLAVVLTNQMTTKVSSEQWQQSHLVPALGESWGHASSVRVILYWHHNTRKAMLYKSPSRQEATVSYQITTAGIRDLELVSETSVHQDEDTTNPSKRPRIEHSTS